MSDTDFRQLGKFVNKSIEAALKRRIDETTKETAKDFLKEFEQILRDEIFDKAIDAFYDDYTPGEGIPSEYQDQKYVRAERGSGNSLYDLLQTEIIEDDGDPAMRFGFDPEQAPPFSSGYNGEFGVYDQSFRKGWHGGYGGSDEQDGPASLRPRWRTGRVKGKNGKYVYRRPGRFARVARKAPFTDYKERLDEYRKNEGPERLREIFLQNWQAKR